MVVCCSQRGGTGFGLECFWPGREPRAIRLPPRSANPPSPLSPSQRGLLPVRLRGGDSPRVLLPALLPTTLPPAWPAQCPLAG